MKELRSKTDNVRPDGGTTKLYALDKRVMLSIKLRHL